MSRHNSSKKYRVQLPHINNTFNTITNQFDVSSSRISLIDKYSYVLVDKNYAELMDKDIYLEYKALRKELFHINEIVAKQLEKIEKKTMKKRVVTQFQPQKIHEVRERQISNNLYILDRMKKEYQGLKAKTSGVESKDVLDEKIAHTKNQITKIKQKITSLKLKNKHIGDSIMATDQIIKELQETQVEWQLWLKKKRKLEQNINKNLSQQRDVQQKVQKMQQQSAQADQFNRQQTKSKQFLEDNQKLAEIYSQKSKNLLILKKNFQVFSNMKQQKYLNLLKQLQNFQIKGGQIQNKLTEVEYNTLDCKEQIRILEEKQKETKIKLEYVRQNQQNSIQQDDFSTINYPQKSVSSYKQKTEIFRKNRNHKKPDSKNSKNAQTLGKMALLQKIKSITQHKQAIQTGKKGEDKTKRFQRGEKTLRNNSINDTSFKSQRIQSSKCQQLQSKTVENTKIEFIETYLKPPISKTSAKKENRQQKKMIKNQEKKQEQSQLQKNMGKTSQKIYKKKIQNDQKIALNNLSKQDNLISVKKQQHQSSFTDQNKYGLVEQVEEKKGEQELQGKNGKLELENNFDIDGPLNVEKLSIDLNRIEKNIQVARENRRKVRSSLGDDQNPLQE